jgi:hypothetical protein
MKVSLEQGCAGRYSKQRPRVYLQIMELNEKKEACEAQLELINEQEFLVTSK